MSRRTPTEDKTLAWYITENKLRPEISAHPVYYFRRQDGSQDKRMMGALLQEYKEHLEEERQTKKANKRRTA